MTNIKKLVPATVFVLIIYYLLMLGWWATIHTSGLVDTNENYYFGLSLGMLSILGGIMGLTKSKKWGGVKSFMGNAIIYLSLGLVTWGIGTLIIGYFNLNAGESYPYPSIADVAYIASWPLWLVGMLNLSKATGARFQLQNKGGKVAALVIVIFAIIFSYYVLAAARGGSFEVDPSDSLRIFFDFAYPVGDVVILTSLLLLFGLSWNYLGGLFKIPILLIIFGFLLNYITDIIFTYTNTIGTFYVASWIDMLYVTTFFVLGVGVNLLDQKLIRHE